MSEGEKLAVAVEVYRGCTPETLEPIIDACRELREAAVEALHSHIPYCDCPQCRLARTAMFQAAAIMYLHLKLTQGESEFPDAVIAGEKRG